jgi:DNA-binding response OmpR family regulator
LHDLPIITMTTNAMKADLDACLAAGMDDQITKPIERKALLQTLRRWLPAPQEHWPDTIWLGSGVTSTCTGTKKRGFSRRGSSGRSGVRFRDRA